MKNLSKQRQGQVGKSPASKNNKNKKNSNRLTDVGLTIPLHVNDVMPPRILRDLNYIDSGYVRNNGGANYLVYAFRANDLFDPDPLILSGSVSGFKELMQFYGLYRVIKTKIHMKITNNESFPLIYGYVFSQASLAGVVGSRDDAINALETNFSTRGRLISAKGGIDTDEIQSELSMSQLLGSKQQYNSEIGYAGVGQATPVIPLYINLIIASPNANLLPNGVTTALTFEYRAEFFGRTNIRA